MRSAPAAALLLALTAFALAARLRGGEGDPDTVAAPPGLGLDRPVLSSRTTLRATLLLPTCPRPIGYAVIPAHDVSIDPSLVAAGLDRGRTVVVYGGSHITDAFTAEIVDALYLARRLARVVGLSRANFSSNFVTRFVVPPECKGVTDVYLAHIVDF